MSNDFVVFQEEFKKWQNKFGLNGYAVYFKYEPIDRLFAKIVFGGDNQVATVTLNSNLPEEVEQWKNVKKSAKHEAIHLLIHRLEMNARWRYTSQSELDEAVEELTIKLEDLIG